MSLPHRLAALIALPLLLIAAPGLHAAVLCADHGGRVPSDEATLRSLPGIGEYTAAAVATFAFGARTVVLDTNVRRVLARVHGEATAAPSGEGMPTSSSCPAR